MVEMVEMVVTEQREDRESQDHRAAMGQLREGQQDHGTE